MICRNIPFGDLRIGPLARAKIAAALDRNWISEGKNVREFEEKFAAKFGWKHAIATSSGTDAGIVVWSAIRELAGVQSSSSPSFRALENSAWAAIRELAGIKWGHARVFTPACAFAATANCIAATGMAPCFLDVDLDTLNLNAADLARFAAPRENNIKTMLRAVDRIIAGVQFVATMGKPTPVREIALFAKMHDLYVVGDFCEGHGAALKRQPDYSGDWSYADHFCDAAIYSFFAAHMVVAGEGGMICTDDDEIAGLCRSIKCHGYGEGPRFTFVRIGYNSKMNELTAAIGLEGLEKFDETFARRRENREKLLVVLSEFEDQLILYPDRLGEIIAPHAFPIVLRNPEADVMPLYRHLEAAGIQCKTLFGSLPTQHRAFEFLGHKLGDFPVAERIGRTGLHFSCSEYLTDEDIDYIAEQVGGGLKKSC